MGTLLTSEVPMNYTLNATGEVLTTQDVVNMFPNESITEITSDIETKLGLTPVVLVPKSITKRQARLALYDMGLLTSVEELLASSPRSLIEWESASEVHIDNPLIPLVKEQLNLTDEQLNQLFIGASTL